jgi:endonuclease III-like uncharacterized protein
MILSATSLARLITIPSAKVGEVVTATGFFSQKALAIEGAFSLCTPIIVTDFLRLLIASAVPHISPQP